MIELLARMGLQSGLGVAVVSLEMLGRVKLYILEGMLCAGLREMQAEHVIR